MRFSFDNIHEIKEFIRENQSQEFIILKFSTKWCYSCEKMNKIIDKVIINRKDIFILETVLEKPFRDSEDSIFNINSVPTILIFHKGIFFKKIEGYIDLLSLKKFLI